MKHTWLHKGFEECVVRDISGLISAKGWVLGFTWWLVRMQASEVGD